MGDEPTEKADAPKEKPNGEAGKSEVVKETMKEQIQDDPEAFKKKWGLDD